MGLNLHEYQNCADHNTFFGRTVSTSAQCPKCRMRAHGRALAALSLLLLLALCPVTCLAEDSAAGHHNNAAEHNNVTGTMEVPPEADGAHGQHEPDEAPPHDPEHEEHPDGYFPGDPIDDQSDGHHDPMSEEEDAALHDQHLDDPSQGREGDFGGVNTPNFDKEPFLSGPHAPEFKGSDGRPIVEPHLVDPLWQEQGLEEPLRFFEPHGQVEILETYDNWNAIDEFSVRFSCPRVLVRERPCNRGYHAGCARGGTAGARVRNYEWRHVSYCDQRWVTAVSNYQSFSDARSITLQQVLVTTPQMSTTKLLKSSVRMVSTRGKRGECTCTTTEPTTNARFVF